MDKLKEEDQITRESQSPSWVTSTISHRKFCVQCVVMLLVMQNLYTFFHISTNGEYDTKNHNAGTKDPRRNLGTSTEDRVDKFFNHDFSFSEMWYRGTNFYSFDNLESKRWKKAKGGNNIKVDILSIGSNNRKDRMLGQVKTWASHKNIRYFFGLTETDDADPDCHKTLTMEDFRDISTYCNKDFIRNLVWNQGTLMDKIIGEHFVKEDYLEGLSPGWLCAQKRFSHGIGKLGRLYQYHHQKQLERSKTETFVDDVQSLPDYLIFVDDDTYYDMDWFIEYVNNTLQYPKDAARVEAGCLIKFAIPSLNFNFPWGGNGLIMNRNAIKNLFTRGINLNDDAANSHQEYNCLNYEDHDGFVQNACQRLKENLFGESTSFVNGMTVSDLMDAHASRDRYSDSDWRVFNVEAIEQQKHKPYCLHSDWATGYYINNYQVSNHVADLHPRGKENSIKNHDARIGWDLGYLEYKTGAINGQGNGTCLNIKYENCDPNKLPRPKICHYATAKQMFDLVPDASPNFAQKKIGNYTIS